MQQARMLGYRVQKFANSCNISPLELSKVIGCSELQMKSFLKGRAFISFDQLTLLANKFQVEISALLNGADDDYNRSIVHCMNDFDDSNNRETILDIIDEYMDILDSVTN